MGGASSGAKLTVSFGSKHSSYLNFLFKLFEPYTNTEPSIISVLNKKTKVTSEVIRFKTVMLPQLPEAGPLGDGEGPLIPSEGIKGKFIIIIFSGLWPPPRSTP